jgi:VWFA-related protein
VVSGQYPRRLNIAGIRGSIQSMRRRELEGDAVRHNVIRALVPGILVSFLAVLLVCTHPSTALARAQNQQQAQPATQQGQISVNAQLVNVDAVVSDGEGNFLPNLKKENFRVLEDGKPQIISNFTAAGEAPITIVILIEFRAGIYTYNFYANMTKYWASSFLNQVKKDDWVAYEDFDLHTRVDVDFTHDPYEILQAMQQMTVPLYSESCVYDAINETLDRLHDVKGKKAILLLASGYDTFSKLTWDGLQKVLKSTDVAIYTIGTSQVMVDNSMNPVAGVRTVQAQNVMHYIASYTGGQAWTPEFDGQIPEIMSQVASSLRNQYSLGYALPAPDGKYHKIKVELVQADGSPLIMKDQKGKKMKFEVFARQGYTAPTGTTGD